MVVANGTGPFHCYGRLVANDTGLFCSVLQGSSADTSLQIPGLWRRVLEGLHSGYNDI